MPLNSIQIFGDIGRDLASDLRLSLWRRRLKRKLQVGRLRADDEGATAIEFGFVVVRL